MKHILFSLVSVALSLGTAQVSSASNSDNDEEAWRVSYSLRHKARFHYSVTEIDYAQSKIADFQGNSLKTIDSVLTEIEERLPSILRGNLELSFRENYLTSPDSIEKIDSFIRKNNLSQSILDIDLSNNRLTSASVDPLKKLLKLCPNLNVDLSINCLDTRDIDLFDPEDRNRIRLRAF